MYMLIVTLAPLPNDVDVVMLVDVEPAATESIVYLSISTSLMNPHVNVAVAVPAFFSFIVIFQYVSFGSHVQTALTTPTFRNFIFCSVIPLIQNAATKANTMVTETRITVAITVLSAFRPLFFLIFNPLRL